MKIILLQNIQKLGKKYEVKEVNDGYARNFLIPKKFAIIFNRQNAKFYEAKELEASQVKINLNANKAFNNLEQIILHFKAKANPQGKLYAQINKKILLEKLAEQSQLKLKKDDLLISKPLKEIGSYLVGVKPNYYDKIKVIIEKYEEN